MPARSACRLAVPMAVALAWSGQASAQMSLLDRLGGAALSTGERLDATTARTAARLPGTARRVAIEAASDHAVRLVDPQEKRLLATITAGAVIPAAILAGSVLEVPERLLATHPTLVATVLRSPGARAGVLAKDGLWPLRRELLDGREHLVVEAAPTLGMTPEAFGRRGKLERLSAQPLVRRMRVVPLVSATDAVVTEAFRTHVADALTPPTSRTEALRLISASRERLVIVAGHVEEEDFVVRTLGSGVEEYRLPIAAVERAAADANAEVLLLGCRVACATAHSGPIRDVTADTVVQALATVRPEGNALDLLRRLSEIVGPLLVQDDHARGFLAIEDAASRARNRGAQAGTAPVRMILHATPPAAAGRFADLDAWTVLEAARQAATAALVVPFMGWFTLLLVMGRGPRRAWREIKEFRSVGLGVLDEILPIPNRALVLYLAMGPWMLVNGTLVLLAAPFGSPWLMLLRPWSGIPVALLGIAGLLRARVLVRPITGPDHPGLLALHACMALPLLLVAVGLVVTAALLAGDDLAELFTFSENAQVRDAGAADGAVGLVCVVYGIALWRNASGLLRAGGLTVEGLTNWPVAVLRVAERWIAGGVQRHAE